MSEEEKIEQLDDGDDDDDDDDDVCCRISQSLQGMSEEEKIEQLELDIKCLQLLRGLIHNEIVKLPDDWELDPSSCKKLVICYAVCL